MPVVSLILGLIVVTVVLVAAMKIGRAILRALFKERSPFADQILSDVAAAALGFMILSAVLFALVAFRLVYRSVLWGVIAACAAVAAPTLARWAGRIPALFKPQAGGATWTAVTGAYFLLAIALSALPPTLNDELIYHLAMPRAWLEAHGGFFFQNNIYAYFPQSGEMFYMLGLGTAGEASARLFHAASGLLLFLAALRYAGLIMDRKHARLAAFALLCVPTMMTILPAAYVDLTFALFTFLAVISVKEYIDGRDVRHALLAGLMLGGAIGVKYTGLQMTALAVCLIAIFRLKKPDLPIFKPIILVAGPAAACALPWLVRNWLLTGWPMFPFSLPFFSLSSALNWDAARAGLYLGFLQAFGAPLAGGTLLNTLTAPVRVFIQGRFNNAEFFDGVAGPVFLLVPLLLLRKKARQGMGLFMTFAIIFLVYWAFSTRQVRFLLPVMPFLALMLANGIQSLKNAWLTRFAAVLLLLNLIPGGVEIAKKAPWDYWTGRISRGDYLARENPVLDFYADTNRLLRPGDRLYLVHMRNYGYSLDHPWEGDFVFERYRLDRLLEAEPGFPAIKAYFAGLKVTHVMINLKAFASNRSGLEEKIPALFTGFLERDCQPILVRGDYGLYRIK
jgi:4-amino-4-deoxy-L-arabinose transferase-like glycosyltransferase